MDVHRMALFNGTAKNVGAISKEAYELEPERLKHLEAELPKLKDMEYWHPVYQAWRPFLDTYFKCGCNSELTREYGSVMMSKEDYLNPPASQYSSFFAEVLRLRSTTGTVLFEDVFYGEISEMCTVQIPWFMENQKMIPNQLHQPQLYSATVLDLLGKNTWRTFLCAIYIYRHCQIEGYAFPKHIVGSLQEKLDVWLRTFLKAFDEVTVFVSGNAQVYKWYCSEVRKVIERIWSTALVTQGRPSVLTLDDVHSLQPSTKESLISYVNACPVVYDNPFKDQTVWDCLCNLYFAENLEDPNFTERTFYALCIPKSYIKRLCGILYDFYWIVKDGKLTGILYDRKLTEYSQGTNLEITPEMYLSNLYMRGFPERRKE